MGAFYLFGILLYFTYFYQVVYSLTCKCNFGEDCKDEPSPGSCPGTIAKDHCGCCKRCRRQIGQTCEGPELAYGVCESGLSCIPINGPNKYGVCQSTMKAKQIGEKCKGRHGKEGVCEPGVFCIREHMHADGICRPTMKEVFRNQTVLDNLTACHRSEEYTRRMLTDSLKCLQAGGPGVYCIKPFDGNLNKCCMSENGCNPNEQIYKKFADVSAQKVDKVSPPARSFFHPRRRK